MGTPQTLAISVALLNCFEGVVQRLDAARARGQRLSVINPVHVDEDFSERWDNRDNAYQEFDRGIRQFAKKWRQVCEGDGNPNAAFKELFGENSPYCDREAGTAHSIPS
jgi:hypothetical protein